MMIPIVFAVVVVLVSVESKTININDIVDLKLELANRISVPANNTIVNYGTGFVSTVEYEGAVGIGLDSIYRTGDCEMRFEGNSITYVYNIGQKIMATFFRAITYQDKTGSGYYRAYNNSLEYSYTVTYHGAICTARLENLALSLDNVEAYIQDSSWDSAENSSFSNFVQEQLLPAFNNKLEQKSVAIESGLETIYCQKSGRDQPTQGLDILRQFLFE